MWFLAAALLHILFCFDCFFFTEALNGTQDIDLRDHIFYKALQPQGALQPEPQECVAIY